MEKVINKNNTSIASLNLKHIRNIAISSLVIEIVAVILGFVAFWLVKDTLAATMSGSNLNVSAIFNAFNEQDHIVSLSLVSAFMFFTFIAFFILPTISACYFGWRLEPEHKSILTSLILATPASLLFLPFVVLAWPVTLLVLISKSEIAIKKELVKSAANKVVTNTQKTKIVDLTTPVTQVQQAPQTVVYRPGQGIQPKPVVNRPVVNTVYSATGRPQTTTVYSTSVRPGVSTGVKPQNTIYVRNSKPN